MRLPLLAALAACAALPVSSQDNFLQGEALQAEVAKSCGEGCITFSREEAKVFEMQLQDILMRKTQEAFKAGVEFQKQACPALVRLI
jgi:hypothetical protein